VGAEKIELNSPGPYSITGPKYPCASAGSAVRRILLQLCLALLSLAAWGQSSDAAEIFDVASIKPAVPHESNGMVVYGCSGGPASSNPGRITCNGTNLLLLIEWAYGVSGAQIVGLARPLETFDIVTKVPAGATGPQVSRMWTQVSGQEDNTKLNHANPVCALSAHGRGRKGGLCHEQNRSE